MSKWVDHSGSPGQVSNLIVDVGPVCLGLKDIWVWVFVEFKINVKDRAEELK